MYKIIGADGKEYGPIGVDQLRQWINEGRANAQTKILAEGATEWKTLSEYPELAAALPREAGFITPPGSPPPLRPIGTPSAVSPDAYSQVNGPATGLIVVGVLLLAANIFSMVSKLLFPSMGHLQNLEGLPPPVAEMMNTMQRMSTGFTGFIFEVIGLAIAIVIIMGGLKMKKLTAHGLAVTASILALLPCTASCCCILGLPIGIWALIVLFRPGVKSSFH